MPMCSMYGRRVYPSDDGLHFSNPMAPHQAIYSVSRFDSTNCFMGAGQGPFQWNTLLLRCMTGLLNKLDANDGFGVMAYTLVDEIFLNGWAMSQPLLNKQTTDIEKCH